MPRTLIGAVLALVALSARADLPSNLNEKTVTELQAMMAAGELTSVQLTQYYIDRINQLD